VNAKEYAMNQLTMNRVVKTFVLGLALPMLLLADIAPEAPLGVGFVREAAAVIGAPLTPVSYAGVARRTTRRTVAVVGTSSAAAATSAAATSSQQQATAQQQQATAQQQQATAQQQAATAQQQQATAQQQAAAQQKAAGAPPLGSMVATLPSGCAATPINGVEYYKCASGVYYRAAFQGNNLVYVATQP
jgi:hypothetical protein